MVLKRLVYQSGEWIRGKQGWIRDGKINSWPSMRSQWLEVGTGSMHMLSVGWTKLGGKLDMRGEEGRDIRMIPDSELKQLSK